MNGRTVPACLRQGHALRQLLDIQLRQIVLAALGHLAGKLIGIEILEGKALAHGEITVEIVHVAVIGIVAAQAGGLRPVGPAHLVEHAVRQRVGNALGRGQQPRRLPGQMAHVHHVGKALLPGVAAVVLALGGGAAQLREEGGVLRRGRQRLLTESLVGVQQRRQLSQIRQGEGGLILRPHGLAALVIAVADGAAQPGAVHGRILCQGPQPAGIQPAVGRLHFLGGH